MIFAFVSRRKKEGASDLRGGVTSRGAVIKHQHVHLLWSCKKVPPISPCLHASLLPNPEKNSILICQPVLSEGEWKKNLANPICPSSLVTGVQGGLWSKSKSSHHRDLKSWHSNTEVGNVYEMEGALMGWPQTRCGVLRWNDHWIKHSESDLSHHPVSAHTGKGSMLIITLAQYGWMRSFTEGGDDPRMIFLN